MPRITWPLNQGPPLITLAGAYKGEARSYFLRAEIAALGFTAKLTAVGVRSWT